MIEQALTIPNNRVGLPRLSLEGAQGLMQVHRDAAIVLSAVPLDFDIHCKLFEWRSLTLQILRDPLLDTFPLPFVDWAQLLNLLTEALLVKHHAELPIRGAVVSVFRANILGFQIPPIIP